MRWRATDGPDASRRRGCLNDRKWAASGLAAYKSKVAKSGLPRIRTRCTAGCWDGRGCFGGDINRLTLKSEGEGRFGESIQGIEVEALYSRTIDHYRHLQLRMRHDFRPMPPQTYATFGFEVLAPLPIGPGGCFPDSTIACSDFCCFNAWGWDESACR